MSLDACVEKVLERDGDGVLRDSKGHAASARVKPRSTTVCTASWRTSPQRR
jgi:hypothetical protein